MLTSFEADYEKSLFLLRENGFSFAGRHTSEFKMYVETYPSQMAPKRKRTTVSVPGRNGDLHFTEDAFENAIQTYKCYFHGCEPMPAVSHEIKRWLTGPVGYQDLTDGYDRNKIRRAVFVGPMDIENTLNRYGRCTITFSCMPQVYDLDSFRTETHDKPFEILASEEFPALPLITVYGTGQGRLYVGTTLVDIKELDKELTLDSETQNAYRILNGTMINKNRTIIAPEFPILRGKTRISWTGGITHIDIIKRGWCL